MRNEDTSDEWMYRTIFPGDLKSSTFKLTWFKYMDTSRAKAIWNYDDHLANPETVPLFMTQKHELNEQFPRGLSFYSYEHNHSNANFVEDLPTEAQTGDRFVINVENVENIEQTRAYYAIVTRRNAPDIGPITKTKLRTFICFKSHSHLPDDCDFFVHLDNNPPGHRTVAPREKSSIPCIPHEVCGKSAAEPQTTPSLFHLLNFQIHCFTMTAAAEPKPLCLNFDENAHLLACVLFSAFENCCEADSKTTVDILKSLELNDYSLTALTSFCKQDIITCLENIFVSEFIDEMESERVLKVLQWIRGVNFEHRPRSLSC